MKSLAATLACCSVLLSSFLLRGGDVDRAESSPTKYCLQADTPGLPACGLFRLSARLAKLLHPPLSLGKAASEVAGVYARFSSGCDSPLHSIPCWNSLQEQHVRLQV